jgi:hypothetical protein
LPTRCHPHLKIVPLSPHPFVSRLISRDEETIVSIREGRYQGQLRKILIDADLATREER